MEPVCRAKIKICKICNKGYTYKQSRGDLTCSMVCYKKYMSKLRMGKNNPRFNNGWRQYITKKDYIKYCEKCKKTDCKLETHHIDGNNKNNEITNLMKVCRFCHMSIDGRFENLNYYNSGTGLCTPVGGGA